MTARSAYILESVNETQRLEEQAELPGYRVRDELQGLSLQRGAKVLDAGCGSGLLSRYLHSQFPHAAIDACDLSAIRLKQAKEISAKQGDSIHYFEASLDQIPVADGTYDQVICRYVLEHLADPLVVCRELFRVLKPGGAITIVDIDGLFFNFHSENKELMSLLRLMEEKLDRPNLYIGREIPSIMTDAGFDKINWRVEFMRFEGKSLEGEIKNVEQRIAFATPTLSTIFGSQEKVQLFGKLYCSEMLNPKTCFFYNKFIVTGKKSA